MLDEDDKIKYSVAWLTPFHDVSRAEILLPDCGVRMLKVRKPDRPSLPDHVYRLKQMFSLGVAGCSLAPCQLCGVEPSVDDTAVAQCSICKVHLHDGLRIELHQ